MPNRFEQPITGFRHCSLLLLTLTLSLSGHAQSAPVEHSGASSDALPFLNQVFELYARASSYHIEAVEETRVNGDFSRTWTKSRTISIGGHNNQYRFEALGDRGSGVQVSNGKTEWIYYPSFHQYTQQTAPTVGPSRVRSRAALGLSSLIGAQIALKNFSNVQKLVRTATYGPDESIQVSGKSIGCIVIRTEGELSGISAHITTRFIFWIDKQTKAIRKMTERRAGPLRATEPDTTYEMERDTLFLVADLEVPSFPDRIFSFEPPMTASLVKEFEDPTSAGIRQFVGRVAPVITLKTADGKETSLQSFQGKPVLLDFWATWCAPCVDSLPTMEQIYREGNTRGLKVLSIDEDDEAKKASDFWAVHNVPWPNFHGSEEILRQFPVHGVPYFVLVDASGRIVFSDAGFDENKLRPALASLDTGSVTTSQAPKP